MHLDSLLEIALTAADAGAAELTSRFRGKFNINTKSSEADYVTDADLASETAVRTTLAQLRPGDTVTGEEYAASEGKSAEYYWSIDPLDGTVNFARGLPNWAVAIGAKNLETGTWDVGVVHAPVLGVTYFATRGGGAFARRGDEVTRLTGPAERSTKIVATGFSYSPEDRLIQFDRLAQLMPHFVDVRRLGAASLDMCMVADGTVDAYYEVGIKEWDWAGALVVAEEAGLQVKRPAFAGDLGATARDISIFTAG